MARLSFPTIYQRFLASNVYKRLRPAFTQLRTLAANAYRRLLAAFAYLWRQAAEAYKRFMASRAHERLLVLAAAFGGFLAATASRLAAAVRRWLPAVQAAMGRFLAAAKVLVMFVAAYAYKLVTDVCRRLPAAAGSVRRVLSANASGRWLPKNIYVQFVAVNLAVLVLTGPLVVLYGPFTNIKSSVVGAIMTSRHPHYLTWLMSEQEIKSIIGENHQTRVKQQALQITKREDDSLRLVTITGGRFKGYLLEIPNPGRVKAATAKDIQEIGDTVSTIALNNNAIAAINAGGFYDPEGTGTGRLPYGIIVRDGKFLVGGDIKDRIDVVGLTRTGMLVTGTYSVDEIKAMGIAEAVTFGPTLIINGKKMITQGDGGWGIAPRSAIGQRQDGTILFLVIDGRQPGYSIGATLLDVQNILYEQGAYTAANLDGGSSATLFYNGKVVNKPADMLGERMVPTAFIVK